MKPPVSVAIIAGAEERNIAGCLESVAWADERVVVCSSKDDRTMEIARAVTTRVMYREFDTFGAQRAFALEQTEHEWVLAIDADERVPAALREEILSVLPDAGETCGFSMPRKGYFLGRWMRHGGWYPDYQLRLFRKSRTAVSTRLVHEGYLVSGPVRRLRQPLEHDTDPSILHHLRKNIEYSRLEALERRKRVRPADLLVHPAAAFLNVYIGKQGWRDGAHGLAAALIHAACNLQQYLYMWELRVHPPRESAPPKDTRTRR